jgi:hypothetical protein
MGYTFFFESRLLLTVGGHNAILTLSNYIVMKEELMLFPNKVFQSALFAVFALLSSATAYADGPDCNKALILSTYDSISSDRLDYRLAESVDEETYKKIKEKHGGSITVPIYGVPVGANYNQFKDNVTSYKRSQNRSESLTRDQAASIRWTGLDPNSMTTYRECLNYALASTRGTVILTVLYATGTDVSVVLRYNKASGQPDTINIAWSTNLKTSDGRPLPQTLTSGADQYIIFRQPTASQQIAVNTAVGGAIVQVAALPQPVAQRCGTRQGSYKFDGSNCGDGFVIDGPRVLVKYGRGGEKVIPQGIPDYDARIGIWLPGDFNGDGLTDLAHVATTINRIHIHFADGSSGFRMPTTHQIAQGYDAKLGGWMVGDDRSSGRAYLIHNPELSDRRLHIWTTSGDGNFSMTTRRQ